MGLDDHGKDGGNKNHCNDCFVGLFLNDNFFLPVKNKGLHVHHLYHMRDLLLSFFLSFALTKSPCTARDLM